MNIPNEVESGSLTPLHRSLVSDKGRPSELMTSCFWDLARMTFERDGYLGVLIPESSSPKERQGTLQGER